MHDGVGQAGHAYAGCITTMKGPTHDEEGAYDVPQELSPIGYHTILPHNALYLR
jgi:hypothetical protein